jgi:2-oxoglutarate/2-oxoacid ferredoxin oxidoreductase subunit beta
VADKKIYGMGDIDIAWCPGCGNFGILNALKEALAELDISPNNLVMASGIGQAAKTPHYLKCNAFNGLHGRALSPATAIKAANPSMVVIAESGDGDMYGEGGNHFIHAIRRNPDIACLIHNNMVYGLTKGQASPTSQKGFKTPIQVEGVASEPFNPIAVAISLDASFVARTFIGEPEKTKEIIKQAITHKGFAVVDIFQPCVSFNKVNTYQWFRDNTYWLPETHDPKDRIGAFKKAIETDKLPLGVFYINKNKPVFEETLAAYKTNKDPLFTRELNKEKLKEIIASKRG